MATYTKPVLTTQSFAELVDRLKQDEKERQRAIEIVQTRGLLAFAEEFFQLNEKQRQRLLGVASDPADEFRWKAILSQGLTDGTPMAVQPSTLEIDCSIDVVVDSNGTVEVDISCEI
ncbi:hypothetical protein [Streptomyces sp. NPDC020681]|uniref:hypothetical protein n=1 Tax=Streptomyces sp. NPDC020681 TaxID=3365083 RepID=UPI0037B4152D